MAAAFSLATCVETTQCERVIGPFLEAVQKWVRKLILLEGWNPKYRMRDQSSVMRSGMKYKVLSNEAPGTVSVM